MKTIVLSVLVVAVAALAQAGPVQDKGAANDAPTLLANELTGNKERCFDVAVTYFKDSVLDVVYQKCSTVSPIVLPVCIIREVGLGFKVAKYVYDVCLYQR
ncbi:hypothetical protein FOCC_FOCC003748 [Frankliniella occidentalis]|uniref:Uncharacterized protein LOC113210191 n=1 Tax=Frankliniella occidentalis TaxID=133901 RepID=A0A6J1SSJ2_FRAOC|nr:uncharacterized protein LOC113210191 [Frankliniella occidentalis]KAE8749482.1 hypothetical protein FOCC_FOCC003748 [Frankliniella occidentalis]